MTVFPQASQIGQQTLLELHTKLATLPNRLQFEIGHKTFCFRCRGGSINMERSISYCKPSIRQVCQPLRTCSQIPLLHARFMFYRYKSALQTASDTLIQDYGQNSGVLVLNLGPAWGNHEAYELFQDNVIEIAFKEWESPPGLGICPLDVIFSVCHTASSWLAQNEKHVVVSLACCCIISLVAFNQSIL